MKETTSYRLKLTTVAGVEFLSPFVYTKDQAERRLVTLRWLVKKRAKFEMTPVSSFPKKAEYIDIPLDLVDYIKDLERRWEEHDYRKDTKEVAEGSVTG